MNKNKKKALARDFRRNSTYSGELLWNALRARAFMHLKFRRQYVLLGYIIDFFCPELNLAVEIDGPIHDGIKDADETRQKIIEKTGILFHRISSDSVETDIKRVLDELSKVTGARTSDPGFRPYTRDRKCYL